MEVVMIVVGSVLVAVGLVAGIYTLVEEYKR